MLQVFFALSVALLGLMAYLIPDWRYLTISSALPTIFGFFIINMIPESPRWLATQGRYDEAEAILLKISVENGSGNQRVTLRRGKGTTKGGSRGQSYGILDFFKQRHLCYNPCNDHKLVCK